jgi:hypothetical protein
LTCRDAESTTELVAQRDIGTMPRGAILSHTPANYDRVQPTEYDNPAFNTDYDEVDEDPEGKEDLGTGNGDYDDVDDDDSYVDMQ